MFRALGFTLVVAACNRAHVPARSPLGNATEPTEPAPRVLETGTSMMRICNETQRDIENVVFYNDYTAGDLRRGECGQYWDMEGVPDSTSVKFFAAGVTFSRDFDDDTKGLPPGYWTYQLRIDDFAKREISVRPIADHPTVVTRVCNDTGHDVDLLEWYETFTEDTMSPGECTPYRPAFVESGYTDGSFQLGSDGTGDTFWIQPVSVDAELSPGRWTFHLEVSDMANRTAALRRGTSPD